MADVHSKETRSYNMSRIKSKNTKPELIVRRFLFANGFRYRINDALLPGKPDIVLKKYKAVIFINGCFWHGHDNCRYFVIPKTNTDWWINKIMKTKNNDKLNHSILCDMGYKVIEIFECELKKALMAHTLEGLINELH